MASDKYKRQLHATYNDIQYIMAQNDANLSSFNAYTSMLQSELAREKEKTLQQLQFKNNQNRAIAIQNLVNGKNIFFTEEEIAKAVTSKLNSNKYRDTNNPKIAIANIYRQLQNGFTNASQTIGALDAFIKAQQGTLPAGSSIVCDNNHLEQVKTQIMSLESYKNGKISNLIGDLGEVTSLAVESAIVDSLMDKLANEMSIDKGQIKATAKVVNKGNQQSSDKSGTVQTDNQLQILFTFDNNIVANFKDLSQGMSVSINLSDKANKKLSTLDSKRRKATNSLTFRSSTVGTMMKGMPPKITSATYNLISYHRQGNILTGFMVKDPGIALRKYFGYKLLQKMFLSSDELNHINFTVYGTSIYAEQEIYDKLYRSGDVIADIEYWTLKNLVGQFTEYKTIEERLQKGTAEANSRIKEMKVAIRASLGLK